MINSASVSEPNQQASGWQGHLHLEFGYRNGATQINRSHVQAPLKFQRPFYPEGDEVCHGVALHTAGGVVGGDRLSLKINLEPQAHALMTTAAATKIYRSLELEARQTVHLTLGEGARLEWLPQETIVFNSANYHQDLRVDLAENALWFGWDLARLGRSARGEQFLNGEWRSRTEVWQSGLPVWIDPQWIQGGEAVLDSPHGLDGCSVVGSFAAIGRVVSPELVQKARSLWIEECDRPSQIGVTRLMSGLVCRYRGHSTQAARRWFVEVWNLMRLEWCDRPACRPRVW